MVSDLDARIRAHLAARIDTFGCCTGCEVDCSCRECTAVDDAVIAVLEQHKPQQLFPNVPELSYQWACMPCSMLTGERSLVFIAYPCKTVKSIAGALGIDDA
jgi:hypothetical protein